jgi:hypothetical protein
MRRIGGDEPRRLAAALPQRRLGAKSLLAPLPTRRLGRVPARGAEECGNDAADPEQHPPPIRPGRELPGQAVEAGSVHH